MTVLHRLLSVVRWLLGRDRAETELDAELRTFVDMAAAARIHEGASAPEARRQATLDLGGLDQVKERVRSSRHGAWLDEAGRDLRYGFRTFIRNPGFSLIAVATLALGIGATTAIYSVVDTILLQPLPFPDSDRLVRIVENFPSAAPGRPLLQRGLTYQEFLDWRAHATTLSSATAVIPLGQRTVRTGQGMVGLWGTSVSSDTFTLLQTRPVLGRTLGAGDDANPDVIVLSFDAWRRYFNGDRRIVGTSIELRAGALQPPLPARLLTVVGVLPAVFELPSGSADFYIPIVINPSRPSPRVTMIGRLAPGVSVDGALQEANVMGAAIRPPWPPTAPALTVPRFDVQGLKDRAVRELRPALRVLLAAVVVVLLIVCANVANLLLARATVRRREVAVRLALGASRGRIVRQVLTECLMLAAAGGVAGALVGAAGLVLVKQLARVDAPGIFRLTFGSTILPRGNEIGVHFKVLAVALGTAAATSVGFGVLPALHLSRTDHFAAMGSRGGIGQRESRIRAALVVGQLALATMLLVGAGLLVRSFINLSAVNIGYDPSNVLSFNLLFPDEYSIPRKAEVIGTLLRQFRAIPDVRSAGFSRHGLLIGEEIFIGTFVPPGRTLDEMRNDRSRVRAVSDGYLTAMGVPLVAGRELEPGDGESRSPVIVINRSAARRYFGTSNPVSQVLDWYVGSNHAQMTVVGVVEDLRQESVVDEVYPEVFVDYRQLLSLLTVWSDVTSRQNEWAIGFLSFALRTKGEPESAVPLVRRVVNTVDPNIGVDAIIPMDRLVASSKARQRFSAMLLGLFAGVAAALAAIGIYGVLAYSVMQRTQEIGIRMALGARRGQVLTLLLRKGLVLATVGIAGGLIAASAGTRALQGMLFGVTAQDPKTFAAVSLLFGFVAALASYVPAHRATKIDPVVALRRDG